MDQGLEKSRVELHKGLEDTLTILNHKLKTKGVHIVRDYANLPRVLAYGSELNQVWTNLIDNAIGAVPEGGTITLRTELDRQGEAVCVEVIDNGAGIPKDVLPRIFEPFFTLKDTGTGLGLAIANKLIQLMGGVLMVESEPGVGSIFSFTVIARMSGDKLVEQAAEQEKSVNDDFEMIARDYPLRILLVEDNEINLKFMTMLMGQMGYDVDVAVNGIDAVKMVEENAYDLIFMDNQMPGMNGMDATKYIRNLKNGKAVTVIGLSASVFKEDIEQALKMGMNDYISKPVKIQEIVNRIKTCSMELAGK
jgi:CheY-like chemotaxis protein